MSNPTSFSSIILGSGIVTASGNNLYINNVPVVMTTGSQNIYGNKIFYDLDDNISLVTNDGTAYTNAVKSLSWSQRKLYNRSGNLSNGVGVDWDAGVFNGLQPNGKNGGQINLSNSRLYTSGGVEFMAWDESTSYINDAAGTTSIRVSNRTLNDSSVFNRRSLDWNNRVLVNSDNVESIYYGVTSGVSINITPTDTGRFVGPLSSITMTIGDNNNVMFWWNNGGTFYSGAVPMFLNP